MMRKNLRTVRQVLDVLGGSTETAKVCGVTPAAASNWLAVGTIPAKHYLAITKRLSQNGIRVDNSVFFPKKTRRAS